MSSPDSSKRRDGTPRFLANLPARSERALFHDGKGRAPETLFGGASGDGGTGASASASANASVNAGDPPPGAESLAPPLPPPPARLPPEAADRLARAIATLEQSAQRCGAEVAATALEIGMLIARRILEAELKTDRSALRALVQSAVRRLGDADRVIVRLAPVDAEEMRASSEAASVAIGVARVEIVADTNLTPGDCFVESDTATVDGRLGTRLEEVRRVLSGALTDDRDVPS